MFQVGEPFVPGRATWQEDTRFMVRNQTLELFMFLPDPTDQEIQAVVEGKLDLGLYAHEQHGVTLLFFLYRLWRDEVNPQLDWHDTVYHFKACQDPQSLLPMLSTHQTGTLRVVLIDCDTGTVTAMQELTVTHTFNNLLAHLLNAQSQENFNPKRHPEHLQNVYDKFSHASNMLRAAFITEEANLRNRS